MQAVYLCLCILLWILDCVYLLWFYVDRWHHYFHKSILEVKQKNQLRVRLYLAYYLSVQHVSSKKFNVMIIWYTYTRGWHVCLRAGMLFYAVQHSHEQMYSCWYLITAYHFPDFGESAYVQILSVYYTVNHSYDVRATPIDATLASDTNLL